MLPQGLERDGPWDFYLPKSRGILDGVLSHPSQEDQAGQLWEGSGILARGDMHHGRSGRALLYYQPLWTGGATQGPVLTRRME